VPRGPTVNSGHAWRPKLRAHDAASCCSIKSISVFRHVKCYDLKPFANTFANSIACFPLIRCLPCTRVKYTSTRLWAAQQPVVLSELNESGKVRGVVNMIAVKHRDQC
jgi:hypothetical protein